MPTQKFICVTASFGTLNRSNFAKGLICKEKKEYKKNLFSLNIQFNIFVVVENLTLEVRSLRDGRHLSNM